MDQSPNPWGMTDAADNQDDNDSEPTLMTHDEATEHLANLEQLVISTQAETVRKAFSALVYFDGCWIEERAAECLAELDLELVATEPDIQGSTVHRVTMEVFYCAIYEYCNEKPAVVEYSVEEDVPHWIEANAPSIMGANIEALEDLLPVDDLNPRRTLIEFHGRIDFDDYVAEQNAVLQETWKRIEARIGVYLAEHCVV